MASKPSTNPWLAGWSTNARASVNGGECDMCCRQFLTKEEKLEWLEDYKSNLEKELQGVTERIQELKK